MPPGAEQELGSLQEGVIDDLVQRPATKGARGIDA
jgi:hypothetical protein